MSPDPELNPQGDKLSPQELLSVKKIPGPLGSADKGECMREGPPIARGHTSVRRQGNCLPRKHLPLDKPRDTEPEVGHGRATEGTGRNRSKPLEWVPRLARD